MRTRTYSPLIIIAALVAFLAGLPVACSGDRYCTVPIT
jgi:hypothetical protein